MFFCFGIYSFGVQDYFFLGEGHVFLGGQSAQHFEVGLLVEGLELSVLVVDSDAAFVVGRSFEFFGFFAVGGFVQFGVAVFPAFLFLGWFLVFCFGVLPYGFDFDVILLFESAMFEDQPIGFVDSEVVSL